MPVSGTVSRRSDPTTGRRSVLEAIARELFGEDFANEALRFPDWHRDAACLEHPELDWFPERGQSAPRAKATCARCLVQADCLGWALDEGPTLPGIWGGTTQRERKRLVASGKVTGDLVRRWGVHAMFGREFERDFPRFEATG